MRLTRNLGVLSTFLVLACQQSHTLTDQQRNIQSGIVQERIDQWAQAINNRELDTLIALYEDSPNLVASLPDGNRASGHEQVASMVTNFFNQLQFLSFNPQNEVIDVVNGQVTVVTFRFSVDIVHNDTSRDAYSGQATMVWIKDPTDDAWRIRVQQLSRNPF